MEASVVDLRYHMNDVLKALARNEAVRVLHRGKVKGVIQPVAAGTGGRPSDHAFFGSQAAVEPVEAVMDRLRGGRHRAL